MQKAFSLSLFFCFRMNTKHYFLGLLCAFLLPVVSFASESEGTIDTGVSTGIGGTVISSPTMSPTPGTYSSTQSVTMTADGSTAICYRTDTTDPTCDASATCGAGDTLYSGSIPVASTTTFRARSCYPGDAGTTASSSVSTGTYTISGGGGGGGGGGGSRCTRPVFTEMSPAKNALVSSLSAVSFVFEDAQADSGTISVDDTELTSETVDNGDGTYTVTATLDTPITEEGTHTLRFSAEKSSSCSRTLVYGITVGTSDGSGSGTGTGDGGTDDSGAGSDGSGSESGSGVSGFVDTIGHWGQDYINTLYSWGAINGKSPTIFDPNANITRAEAIKIALLVKGSEIPSAISVSPFPDVVTSAWYAPFIQVGKKLAIIGGFSDGTYGPNKPVSRVEALKILLLAANIDVEGYSTNTPFTDIESYAWYAPLVAWASDKGVVSGKGNLFSPHVYITRAEFSKVAVLIFSQ